MDSDLMKDYIEYFNNTEISEHRTPKMMVYDSFKGHLEDSIKKKFHDNGGNSRWIDQYLSTS